MMRIIVSLVTLLAVMLIQAPARAAVVAQSTFDTNHDNWTATFGANNITSGTFNGSDGNPPGSLRTMDVTGTTTNVTWYFQSSNVPGTTFYGDMSAAYGNSITYDLKRFVDPGAEYYTEFGGVVYDVILTGVFDNDMNGSLESSMRLGFGSPTLTPITTGVWQHLSIPLLASAGWFRDNPVSADVPATEPQLMAVLLNLRHIEIRGNYSLPVGDSTGLDNVTLVPEASGFAMASLLNLFVGVFGNCGRRRRRC